MKARIAFACLLFALLVACEPYNRSNSGLSATEKTLLYDFRDPKLPDRPKLDRPTEHNVLAAIALYPACSKGEEQTVLTNAVATGAFTAPSTNETAYLVDVNCKPSPQHLDRLLVFGQDKLIASVEVPESTILKTSDLNRDGKNELLLANWSEKDSTMLARLVQFDKASSTLIENFGIVYANACAGATGGGLDALVLSYLPHPNQQMPSFTAQRYRADCPAQGQAPHWTAIAR